MSNKKNIIFIYNAKGGQWNYLIDTLHKYLSPKTYECNLCQITYDLKMRKAWKDFIEESPHNYKFLHLEELSEFGLEAYVKQDGMDFDDALPYLAKKSAETFAGPDAQEGISAFLEKREPNWD